MSIFGNSINNSFLVLLTLRHDPSNFAFWKLRCCSCCCCCCFHRCRMNVMRAQWTALNQSPCIHVVLSIWYFWSTQYLWSPVRARESSNSNGLLLLFFLTPLRTQVQISLWWWKGMCALNGPCPGVFGWTRTWTNVITYRNSEMPFKQCVFRILFWLSHFDLRMMWGKPCCEFFARLFFLCSAPIFVEFETTMMMNWKE